MTSKENYIHSCPNCGASMTDMGNLEIKIAELKIQRDDAREAANWILEHRPLLNTLIMLEVYSRWPWIRT